MGEERMPYYEHPFLPVREVPQSARTPLSDLMIVKSTSPGYEGVPHAWIGDSAYAKVAEVDAIPNSRQPSVSKRVSLDQGHLYTHADTGPYSASPFLGIPSTSTVGQYEGTSRNLPIQSPRTTKKRATASSRSSGRPTGACKVPEKSYSCEICGEEYAQTQGVRRHIRTEHHPSSCLFCDFKWGRPDHYRNHLTKWHELEAAVVDEILGKPAGSRRRTSIIGRDLPQNVSSPVMKYDRLTQPKPRQRRLMPPLSSVEKVTHVPSTFSSTEALAQPANDVDHAFRLSPTCPRSPLLQPLVQPREGRHLSYPHTNSA